MIHIQDYRAWEGTRGKQFCEGVQKKDALLKEGQIKSFVTSTEAPPRKMSPTHIFWSLLRSLGWKDGDGTLCCDSEISPKVGLFLLHL